MAWGGAPSVTFETRPDFLALGHESAIGSSFPRVLVADGERSRSVARDGHHEVVKDRSRVVDHITSEDGDALLWLLGDPKLVEPDIRLLLWWRSPYRLVWVSTRVAPYLVCEVTEALFRPIELEPPGFRHAAEHPA